MLLALFLALLPFLPAPQPANLFESDDRVLEERRLGSPFAAVAIVVPPGEADSSRFGSGVLVSPCHLLTAHHVAFPSPAEASPAVLSRVWVGPPTDSFPFSESALARPVAWGDLTAHAHEDWALLALEPCLGARWGWWELAPVSFAAVESIGLTLASAGHPAWGTRAAVTVDPTCRVHAEVGRIPGWWLDCAVSVGQSGGPIYRRGSSGRPQVVAIIAGDFSPQAEVIPSWDPRAANVAIPVASFFARIEGLLAAAAH